jgi:hypothetical protein
MKAKKEVVNTFAVLSIVNYHADLVWLQRAGENIQYWLFSEEKHVHRRQLLGR